MTDKDKIIHELWMKIWLMEEEINELRRDLYYANLKLDTIEEDEEEPKVSESTPTELQTNQKSNNA